MSPVFTRYAVRRLGVVALCLCSACVDHNYDLKKDIDLSVGVGGEFLAVPVGNTEPIRLGKIIKTDDADLLQVDARGNYRLSKQDLFAVDVPKVDPVTIRVAPHVFEPKTLDFGGVSLPPQGTASGALPSAPVEEESVEPVDTPLPVQVLGIDWLEFRHATHAELTIRISGATAAVRKMKFEGLRLIFPAYVRLTESGTNEIAIDDEFAVAEGYTRRFGIERLTFDRNPVEDGQLRLQVPVRLEGRIAASQASPSGGPLDGIVLEPGLAIEDMDVGLLQGRIDPGIQQTHQLVELEGMPDFLQGDDVVLDVEPRLAFQADNTLGMALDVNLKASPQRNGEVIEEGVNDIDFRVDAAEVPGEITATRLWLAVTDLDMPEGYRYVPAPRLPELVKKVPAAIDLQVEAVPDLESPQRIDLGVERYALNLHYELDIPLSFGPALHLLYWDTMKGFLDDIGDFVDKVTQVEITCQADNTIPLKLTCRAIPVDRYLDPLEGVEVSAPGTIQPGGLSGEVVRSPFDVTIRETTRGALAALDGLILEVSGDGEQNVAHIPLNESQYLQFTMKLKVPGGLHLDLDDL